MRIWLPAIRVGTGVDVFPRRLTEGLQSKGIEPVLTWFRPEVELLPELMRLRRLPAGIDVIHANSANAHAFLARGVPVVATVHHLVHDPAYAAHRSRMQAIYHRWHVRWREEMAIAHAAAVTAVSPYVAGTVRSCFGRADVHVIPNWIDSDRFRPAVEMKKRDGARFRLLWVGNPSRRKGFDLLPGLVAELGRDFEIRCVTGLRNDRIGFDNAAGLTLLGRISEAQLIEEYQACDALLSLSRYEGFGYSAIEAMACGKPVVAFAAGGLADVVQDGTTGLLAPVGDLRGLAKHIRNLATDSSLLRSMGLAARARVRAQGDPVDAYVALYRRLCGSNAGDSKQSP